MRTLEQIYLTDEVRAVQDRTRQWGFVCADPCDVAGCPYRLAFDAWSIAEMRLCPHHWRRHQDAERRAGEAGGE